MPTANQRLYEATVRHQVHLLRFAEGQAKRALELLVAAEAELLGDITTAMAAGRDAGRLESLLTSIKQRRAQVYGQLGKDMKEALKGLAEADGKWEEQAVAGSVPIQLNMASVPLEQLHAIVESPINGLTLDRWLDGVQEAEVSKLQQAVSLAMLQGQTIDQLTQRIRGTKANGFTDGILAISTRNAQALARTAVSHVSNQARESVWEANSDIVRALRWTSTLDGRTSTMCQARDGHLTPIGDSALGSGEVQLVPPGARPPGHFQCRSLMVAVLDGVAIAGDRPFVADERTRAAREADFKRIAKEEGKTVAQVRSDWADKNVGRVPAKTTYQDWLKGQPHEFQDEVLGRGKAELFRKGVPLERFVDASGKTLSLQALKAELAGDALNVMQPAIGLKAKGLLLQGATPDEVLSALKMEFPDAKTGLASIASYKSELNKAGLLDNVGGGLTSDAKYLAGSFAGEVAKFENGLPTGVKQALSSSWYSVVENLEGSPGAYAHYKPGIGVVLADAKLSGINKAQAQQIIAHELGHLLHKEHGVGFNSFEKSLMKEWADDLDPQSKKLYAYYLAHDDELTAEIVGQALNPSGVTSQGIGAAKFNEVFGPLIENAKTKLDETFPVLAAKFEPVGLPIPGLGEMAGKPTSIGAYAKALLKQGMPDDDVLTAVKATFPDAKTGMASIKSYKSELKKLDAVGKPGPVVVGKLNAEVQNPQSPFAKYEPGGSDYGFDPVLAPTPEVGEAVDLAGFFKVGSKPGGSNPGALYEDANGDTWLIKGNKQRVDGNVPADVSDARARNEVLAARLINIAGGSAPEMKLVNLGKEYGGGLGVASKIVKGSKLDKTNPNHVLAARKDFAIHAWLGNHDVVGETFDNLLMVNGKANNIDPGGAMLFRAQGLLKKGFGTSADEWVSMRAASTNPQAAVIYGQMTAAQLKEAAEKLLVMTDEVIDRMVAAHGPAGYKLADILKKRRDDILERASLTLVKVEAPAPNPLGVPFDMKGITDVEMKAVALIGAKKLAKGGYEGEAAAKFLKLKYPTLSDDIIKEVLDPPKSDDFGLPVTTYAPTTGELESWAEMLADKGYTNLAEAKAIVKTKFPLATDKALDDLFGTGATTKSAGNPLGAPDTSAKTTVTDVKANIGKLLDEGHSPDAAKAFIVEKYPYKPGDILQKWVDEVVQGGSAGAPVAPSVAWGKLSASQLVDQLLGGVQTGTYISGKTVTGSITASKALKPAMALLFKAGVKTSVVEEALKLKYPSLAHYVPKSTSLASLKSALKKDGMLDGPVQPVVSGVGAPGGVVTPNPKLFGQSLGGKSMAVKDGLKNLIAQGADYQKQLDFVKGQFSTFNAVGAQDLIELANWEYRTGKLGQPGVAALQAKQATVALPTPTPSRPAMTPGEGRPPPPRFSDDDRMLGVRKYGEYYVNSTQGLTALNARQAAAGLEKITTAEYVALRAYTGGSYGQLNSKLRGAGYAKDLHLQAFVDAAQHALAKMPKYRGPQVIRNIYLGTAETAELRGRYLPGSVVEEHAFVSASTNGRFGAGGNIQFRITTRTGVDVDDISTSSGEAEVLMAPGTRFRVQSVRQEGAKLLIELVETDD